MGQDPALRRQKEGSISQLHPLAGFLPVIFLQWWPEAPGAASLFIHVQQEKKRGSSELPWMNRKLPIGSLDLTGNLPGRFH